MAKKTAEKPSGNGAATDLQRPAAELLYADELDQLAKAVQRQ